MLARSPECRFSRRSPVGPATQLDSRARLPPATMRPKEVAVYSSGCQMSEQGLEMPPHVCPRKVRAAPEVTGAAGCCLWPRLIEMTEAGVEYAGSAGDWGSRRAEVCLVTDRAAPHKARAIESVNSTEPQGPNPSRVRERRRGAVRAQFRASISAPGLG